MPKIEFEDRPELEHRGARFVAFYAGSPCGVRGYGNCQDAAQEDLHAMAAEHLEWVAEKRRAEVKRYGFNSGEGA